MIKEKSNENKYPKTFWVANGVELLERAAFYAMFISGFLLDAYCPDPQREDLIHLTKEQLAPYYANADYIWYIFAAIGFLSAFSLIIYDLVVKNIDKRKMI